MSASSRPHGDHCQHDYPEPVAHLLSADALHLDFGSGTVLDSVSLGLDDGDRIGIVGDNGAGKSSLVKLLDGRLEPHEGRVTRARGVTVGVLDQDDGIDLAHTVIEAIVGDADDHEWSSDPRVRDIMTGLVPDIAGDALVGSLSGGQQRRVALARVLVGDHDVLFLDEPTNHLDVDGVTWLAEHVKRRWGAGKGALAVITHDRWFLDEVSTDTWEVHHGRVDQYEGGYASYVLQRVERDRVSNVTEQRRQNLMRKELAWLRRGAPARTSKPKFRIEAANALIEDVPPVRDTAGLVRLAAARLGKEVVNVLNCSVTYGTGDDAVEVLKDVEWRIGPGERTGILGENGAGKSTLLKLISGELQPTSGRVKRGLTVKVSQLSQHLHELDEYENERLRAVVKRYHSTTLADGTEMSPGQLLERLGFTSAQLSIQVGKLSGGQRRRLQLLLVLLSEPNVLVLDEPTNDLDTDMLAAIEDLLDAWPGALIVVSHDRYLLERVTDQQYAVTGGALRHLPGGIDQYIELSRERRAKQGGVGAFGGRHAFGKAKKSKAQSANARAAVPTGNPRERKRSRTSSAPTAAPELAGAERRVIEKEVAAAERRLQKLTQLSKKVHAEMAGHNQSDFEGLKALNNRLRAYAAETATLEGSWLEMTDQLG